MVDYFLKTLEKLDLSKLLQNDMGGPNINGKFLIQFIQGFKVSMDHIYLILDPVDYTHTHAHTQ
jgi:hypothetical protein